MTVDLRSDPAEAFADHCAEHLPCNSLVTGNESVGDPGLRVSRGSVTKWSQGHILRACRPDLGLGPRGADQRFNAGPEAAAPPKPSGQGCFQRLGNLACYALSHSKLIGFWPIVGFPEPLRGTRMPGGCLFG